MQHIFITDTDFSNTDMSFRYLLGFQPSLACMLLQGNTLRIFLDGRYFSKTSQIPLSHIRDIFHNPDLEIDFIESSDFIEDIGVFLEGEGDVSMQNNIALKYYELLQEKLPHMTFTFSQGFFQEQRAIKTGEEKEKMKRAITIIDEVYSDLREYIQSGAIFGKTEQQLRQYIIQKIFEYGGEGESFDSIVAFGKNSAVPHHVSGETIISNGVLLIDMGAKYQGYCSDFTRTVWVGDHTDAYGDFQEAYEVVKEAHNRAVQKFTPGMIGANIDKIARDLIQDTKFHDLFIHNLGHSLGLDIHEDPRIGKKGNQELREGMVFTIEPGVYKEGEFGIRLEDIVFVEQGKLQKYTRHKL